MNTPKPDKVVAQEEDRYYGIIPRFTDEVLAAIGRDSSPLDFETLDAAFVGALKRLGSREPAKVASLLKYYSEAKVIVVTRGLIAGVISMQEYGEHMSESSSSDSLESSDR